MAEFRANIIGAAQGPVQLLSAAPRIEQVRPILEELMRSSGIPAGQVQEIHWHGGDDEYWLSGLGESHGFASNTARFFWPVTPMLVHTMLQFTARSIESGDRDLILLGQETGGHAAVLLLASAAAVGRQNISAHVCVGAKMAFCSTADGLPAAARAALEGSGQNLADVRLLAAARRVNASQNAFPQAQWISPGSDLPSGDLFLAAALFQRLQEERQQRGLLLSSGPQKSGLATMLERVE